VLQQESPSAVVSESLAFLSRRDVARVFGVSASTVTRWAQRGLLPTVRTPGGHYRFPAADVHRAAQRSGVPTLTRLD
jgi:excisionase family DNA binding protein